jgi:hypothetical protein
MLSYPKNRVQFNRDRYINFSLGNMWMLFPKEEEEYREWFHIAGFDSILAVILNSA